MNKEIKYILEHGKCDSDCINCPLRSIKCDTNDVFRLAQAFELGAEYKPTMEEMAEEVLRSLK